MKATLSWLSVQPLTVKTTEEGGVGGGLPCPLCTSRGEFPAVFQQPERNWSGHLRQRHCSWLFVHHSSPRPALSGTVPPPPCCAQGGPGPRRRRSPRGRQAQRRRHAGHLLLLTTDVAQLHLGMMLALVKRDSTEGITNWVISLIFRAWQWLAEGLQKSPARLVSVSFPATILIPTRRRGPQQLTLPSRLGSQTGC